MRPSCIWCGGCGPPALAFLGVVLIEAGKLASGVRLQTVAAGRVRGDLIWFWLAPEAPG